jgi:hypothetical protein
MTENIHKKPPGIVVDAGGSSIVESVSADHPAPHPRAHLDGLSRADEALPLARVRSKRNQLTQRAGRCRFWCGLFSAFGFQTERLPEAGERRLMLVVEADGNAGGGHNFADAHVAFLLCK